MTTQYMGNIDKLAQKLNIGSDLNTKTDRTAEEYIRLMENKTIKEKLKIAEETKNLADILLELAEEGKLTKKIGILPDCFNRLTDMEIDGSKRKLKKIKTKTAFETALMFVSDDITRYVLQGVLHDPENNVIVGSDGRQLIIIPEKVSGEKRIIGKDGNISGMNCYEIDGTYPNYEQVIPKYEQPINIPLGNIDKLAQKLNIGSDLNTKTISLISIVKIKISSEKTEYVNPVLFSNALNALVALGTKKIELVVEGVKEKYGCVCLQGNNGVKVILVGLRLDNYENYFTITLGEVSCL